MRRFGPIEANLEIPIGGQPVPPGACALVEPTPVSSQPPGSPPIDSPDAVPLFQDKSPRLSCNPLAGRTGLDWTSSGPPSRRHPCPFPCLRLCETLAWQRRREGLSIRRETRIAAFAGVGLNRLLGRPDCFKGSTRPMWKYQTRSNALTKRSRKHTAVGARYSLDLTQFTYHRPRAP